MDRVTVPTTSMFARPVWRTSVPAFLAAAVATELYGLLARGAGIRMAAGNPGGNVATPITVGMFAMATLLIGVVATMFAVVVARYATNPSRVYLRTTIVLTLVSCAAPMSAGDTALSTKLMLCGGHVVAAAIVIPIVTRRLGARPLGRPAARRPAGPTGQRDAPSRPSPRGR